MKPSTEHARQVCLSRIVDALTAGGVLTDDVLNFIDASLFPPEPEALAAFLTDDDNSERDTLLDLIFYPDQAFQVDLEPLLEAGRFSPADEKRILTDLLDADIDASARMPNGRDLVCLRLPDFIKKRYLDRLNIAWQPHPDVYAAIDNRVSAPLRPVVKVRLRNAGVRFESDQALFLGRYFTRMDDGHPDFLACLELVLALLDDNSAAVSFYSQLVDYKRTCFRGLQQARRFESLLRRFHIENPTLQGIPPPPEAPGEFGRPPTPIDRLCLGG